VAPDRPDGSSPVTPDEALAALDATSPRRSS
jgi:hypothetical protein